MSDPRFFFNGQGIIVTTFGPGKVHLLSYASNNPTINVPHIGTIATTAAGRTRFVISHSYDYNRFAIYWEGTGDAVCGKGQDLERQPVGKSWEQATCVDYLSTAFVTRDVTVNTTGAINRDNVVTCFIIPDGGL